MRRLFAVILLILLTVGCKSQAPVYDPFFGRTTIPPPPTGSVTGQGADPCYQPPPLNPPSSTTPPMVQLPMQPTANSPLPTQPIPGPAPTAQPSLPSGSPSNTWAPRPLSTAPTGPSAPRPSSTVPTSPSVPRPSSTVPTPAPGVGSPYMPPGGNFDYRGTSTTKTVPLASSPPGARPPSVSYTNVSANRAAPVGDDRMPRPVDDSVGDGSIAGRKPIIRTIQPRVGRDASSRPIDIMDLPKIP